MTLLGLLLVLVAFEASEAAPKQSYDIYDTTETSYGRTCIPPYRRVGEQCLFFSRPYAAWGLEETWNEAYANFYDAVAVCRQHGGDLAKSIEDYGAALRYCLNARGGCAPSLLWRHNKCFEWSPIDGTEVEVNCKTWEITRRFVCEMRDFDGDY